MRHVFILLNAVIISSAAYACEPPPYMPFAGESKKVQELLSLEEKKVTLTKEQAQLMDEYRADERKNSELKQKTAPLCANFAPDCGCHNTDEDLKKAPFIENGSHYVLSPEARSKIEAQRKDLYKKWMDKK